MASSLAFLFYGML
jgi:hypothetical protein